MSRAVADIEREILALTEEQRARLAASILDSLPGVLADQDGGWPKRRGAMRSSTSNPSAPFRLISWTK